MQIFVMIQTSYEDIINDKVLGLDKFKGCKFITHFFSIPAYSITVKP